MKMGKASNSSNGESSSNGTKVVLHVYDLTHINNYSYRFGLGIFHSGIEVHGKEYDFGAHEFPATGVFEVEPKNCPGFAYRCSISLGSINMSLTEFTTFIEKMASQYYGNSYHLISKNCNHFTDDVVHKLTSKHIPGWVNRLARLGSLFSCILPESLQATRVKKVEEVEDETDTPLPATATDSSKTNDKEEKKLLLSSKAGNSDINFVKEAQSECKEP
ncbi:DeSI-like protein [Hibiscus syriacus]|uniref:DeSI-like protein n=1 Tax=Hibiscus syriacus TaxID=106335 RepID=A0A6A3B3Z7_HIBSY|nr:deSI-like protein At4g17486 [Hibiscus syriacus]KAE8710397.1 DeSI-like protein [Hibiscus syriacus]